MEQHRIDVRDIDTEWFVDVAAYLDRQLDLWYFPLASIERLGELDEEGSGNYWLLDGRVEAEADELEVNGSRIPAWSVRVGQITTRPAK